MVETRDIEVGLPFPWPIPDHLTHWDLNLNLILCVREGLDEYDVDDLMIDEIHLLSDGPLIGLGLESKGFHVIPRATITNEEPRPPWVDFDDIDDTMHMVFNIVWIDSSNESRVKLIERLAMTPDLTRELISVARKRWISEANPDEYRSALEDWQERYPTWESHAAISAGSCLNVK